MSLCSLQKTSPDELLIPRFLDTQHHITQYTEMLVGSLFSRANKIFHPNIWLNSFGSCLLPYPDSRTMKITKTCSPPDCVFLEHRHPANPCYINLCSPATQPSQNSAEHFILMISKLATPNGLSHENEETYKWSQNETSAENIILFFVLMIPPLNLQKYDLQTLNSYCTTGPNLYKYDLAVELLQV